jgi:hypothetical protein
VSLRTRGETRRLPTLGIDDGRIPLRVKIGITGHREFTDDAAVAEMLGARMQRVRELYPASDVTPLAFRVLTALAAGADQLAPRVAHTALAGCDVDTEVVLPLTVPDYLDDFDENTRHEFRRLLREAASRVDLAPAPKVQGNERKLAYERAGHYIVDHSDIVIAVWDGAPGDQGGTAKIVEYARAHLVPLLIVPVTRQSTDPATSKGWGETDLEPAALEDSPRWRATREEFARLEELNRVSVVAEPLAVQSSGAATSWRKLSQPAIHDEVESTVNWVLPQYARADQLAMHYQARYNVLSSAIHFLAALAVAAVAYVVAFRRPDAWLGLEIFFLALLVAAVRLGRHGRWRERWMGYRSLAEAFRSAEFIALAGGRQRGAPDHGMLVMADGQFMTDGPWFQRAFSEVWKSRPQFTLGEEQAAALRAFVVTRWIDDQLRFHEATAKRHLARRNVYTYIVYTLAAITIVVAALHIAGIPRGRNWSETFTFIAITLPGFGAAVTGMREGGQHRLHEERSRQTIRRLQQLKSAPYVKPDLASVRALVIDTHRVIVEESVGWSTVLEFHDLEMVI